jgi:SNF2-related domain/PLD-like domain
VIGFVHKDTSIIDNLNVKFIDKFKAFSKFTNELKIASGYFYVSGFNLVKNDLYDIKKIRIVMGNETDLDTAEQLDQGYIKKIKKELESDLQTITDENKDVIDSLKDLCDFVTIGKIEVKVYVAEKFHAKAYIFERKNESIPDIAIVGSSNFSRSGMGTERNKGNTELNSIHKNDNDIAILKVWYEQIWEQAKPFGKELLHIIENSQPYIRNIIGDTGYVSPIELFKIMSYEFLDHDTAAFKEILAEFQKIGVINAKQKINDFNGCIISDSVGLGKTLTAAELIKDFQKEGKNVLLVVPSSVKENWIREMVRKDTDGIRYFDIKMEEDQLKIITITELSNLDLNNTDDRIIMDLLKDKYSVIVIDESHRFRNFGKFDSKYYYTGNKNYANLQYLKTPDKKYVLLTATPLNNSVNDLANLISIFTNPTILKNKDNSLDFSNFTEYVKLFKKLSELDKKGTTDFQINTKLKLDMTNHLEGIAKILEEIMILRTRTDISDRYPDLIIEGKRIFFKIPIINIKKYDFPKTYYPIYEHISDLLSNLHVPHIALINESIGLSLSGLYRILLFKRLESSIYSFIEKKIFWKK